MAYADTVVAPTACLRADLIGEDDKFSLLQRYGFASGLPARPLLDEQELSSFKIGTRSAEHAGCLQGKGEIAVDILVQARNRPRGSRASTVWDAPAH